MSLQNDLDTAFDTLRAFMRNDGPDVCVTQNPHALGECCMVQAWEDKQLLAVLSIWDKAFNDSSAIVTALEHNGFSKIEITQELHNDNTDPGTRNGWLTEDDGGAMRTWEVRMYRPNHETIVLSPEDSIRVQINEILPDLDLDGVKAVRDYASGVRNRTRTDRITKKIKDLHPQEIISEDLIEKSINFITPNYPWQRDKKDSTSEGESQS